METNKVISVLKHLQEKPIKYGEHYLYLGDDNEFYLKAESSQEKEVFLPYPLTVKQFLDFCENSPDIVS